MLLTMLIVSQVTTTVERIVNIIAIIPTFFDFESLRSRYLTAGQRPSGGRKMLIRIIPTMPEVVIGG